jgi:hypothetical protein
VNDVAARQRGQSSAEPDATNSAPQYADADAIGGPGAGGGVSSTTGIVAMASGMNVLLGLWLIIAPWVLDYSTQENAVWNQVVIGIAITTLALVRAAVPSSEPALSWTNFVLGGWLVLAPFVLTYNDTTSVTAIYWNDIIVGLAVLTLAGISAAAGRGGRQAGAA